jgi:hypothetical protein
LSVEEITRTAFGLRSRQVLTRKQRLSATRAAHRLVQRVKEMDARADELREQAHKRVQAALGLDDAPEHWYRTPYGDKVEGDPAWRRADELWEEANRIGMWSRHVRGEQRGTLRMEREHWRTTTIRKRLYFHPPDVPVQVWAVTIDPSGVHWFDADVTKITARNVMVRYRGEHARLDRQGLFYWWAMWRAVRFVSSRTGRIAVALEEVWWERYGTAGTPPPAMQMPLEQARLLLGLPVITRARTSSPRSAARPKKPIPISAAPRKCFGPWSRRVTGCSPLWGRARRRPSRRTTRRRGRPLSIAVDAQARSAN